MKYELNFYKSTGKWYAKEVVDIEPDSKLLENYPLHRDMDYTAHIVESNGYLRPFRMYKG